MDRNGSTLQGQSGRFLYLCQVLLRRQRLTVFRDMPMARAISQTLLPCLARSRISMLVSCVIIVTPCGVTRYKKGGSNFTFQGGGHFYFSADITSYYKKITKILLTGTGRAIRTKLAPMSKEAEN